MPRKQAFSGKQKKEQLKAKKQSKGQGFHHTATVRQSGDADDEPSASFVRKMGVEKGAGDQGGQFTFFESKPVTGRGETGGRYALMFRPESKAEIEQSKLEARQTIYPVSPEYLECQIEDFFTPQLDFPTRPNWDFSFSKQELESREAKYFNDYLKRIDDTFDKSELSYFELNLETWRQFWRVLEMSDILLCIVDARYPPLLFPPKLYEYSSKALGKHIILILNKIDLVPAPLVLAWKDYLKNKYPELEILCFTSYPSYNLHGNANAKSLKARKRRGKLRMAAEGALELYKVCEKIVAGQVDLSSWKEKIHEEMSAADLDEEESELKVENVDTSKPDTGYFEFKKFGDGILTIGCLGQPNVGKSSLINAIMGKKVVSVSKTPGHTKHFQTIFLTSNVRLCDCPGLIFPSKVPKALQVLAGSYPIAQLREPYSTVKYLAERLPLPQILNITHPEQDDEWSAYDIADGWAQKRGFYTAKAARLDSYRGANHLLRIALEGRICLSLRPPGFTKNEETWTKDVRVEEIERIQAKSRDGELSASSAPLKLNEADDFSTSEDEEEEESGSRKTINKLDEAEKKNVENESSSSSGDEEVLVQKPSRLGARTKVQNKFALLNEDE